MRLPARRWKASSDRAAIDKQTQNRAAQAAAQCLKMEGRASRPSPPTPYCTSTAPVTLEHLDAIDVDLIAVHVPGHGNVMSFVTLEGVGIVHRQNLLVSVRNNDCAGAGCDALLCASLRTRIRSFNAALRVANPAVHGLGIAGK